MGQVLLVRHGQASWGSADYDVLSESGWEQSRLLGEALAARGVEPTLVVHGTMRRHRETAEAAREGLATPEHVVDEGWDEFDHLAMLAAVPSPFEGREPSRAEFQSWFEESTNRWTGGEHDADYDEPFTGFTERVAGALRRTAEAAGSGTAVVFTSGGPVSWAASSLVGAELDQPGRVLLWRRLNPVCVNSGVTKVVTGSRGLTLVSFNEHTHLEQTPELLTYR
ncbi:MAG: histidine phosphatase family protein [Marmoricola sp.]